MLFWNSQPANALLRNREPNQAYLTARPGTTYALFFPDGGQVQLDLRDAPGTFTVHWIDIATGEWDAKGTLDGGDWRTIETPGPGFRAAAIVLP